MPASFEIDVDGVERNISGLERVERDAPDLNQAQSSRVADFFVEEISRTIRQQLNWTGKMSRSVRRRQRRVAGRFATGFEVFIDAPMENGRGDYAAWNENANTGHWVSITPENYPINEWASDVGLDDQVRAIYVTPQPFMSSAVRKGVKKMNRYVNQGGEVNEFLDKAGF